MDSSDEEKELHDRIRKRLESMHDDEITKTELPPAPAREPEVTLVTLPIAIINAVKSPLQLAGLISIVVLFGYIVTRIGKFW